MVTPLAEIAFPHSYEPERFQLRLLAIGGRRWLFIAVPYGVVALLCLLLLPQGHGLDVAGAVTAVMLFIAASQVELHLKTGWVGCQQAAFVLLLFAVPLNAVPLVASLSLMVAQAIKRRSLVSVVCGSLCDSWYAVAPVLLLSVLSPGHASWTHWPSYVVVFACQLLFSEVAIAAQFAVSGERFNGGDELMPVAVDTMLTPIGLAAAVTVVSSPAAAAAMLIGVTGLLAVLGQEHRQRRTQTRRALSDPLTGLANRALLSQMIDAAQCRCERSGQRAGLVLIDLDDFKSVNDTLGHQQGDELLVAVAERLRSCTRVADTVARVGGDEFALVLAEPIDQTTLQRVTAKLRASLAEPLALTGTQSRVIGASIGASTFGDGAEAAEAMTLADLQLYDDKRARKEPLRRDSSA